MTELGKNVRPAMELGVDIVKTFYTGAAESFAEVVHRGAEPTEVAARYRL